MIRISDSQWQALQEAHRNQLCYRVVRRLRVESPMIMARWKKEDHFTIAQYSEARAAEHRVETYRARADWILLSFVAGPNFFKAPNIAAELEQTSDPASYTHQLLEAFVDLAASVPTTVAET